MPVGKSSLLALLALLFTGPALHAATPLAENIRTTLESVCTDCHDTETRKGGLDLSNLTFQPENPANRNTWIQIHDRVKNREMPPKSATLEDPARSAFVKALVGPLTEADQAEVARHGRGPLRRLTRTEYEQSLRDLLHLPDLELRDSLPEDREKHLFTRTSEALEMSRVQMNAYLDAAETALRSAIVSTPTPPPSKKRLIVGTDLFPGRGTFGNKESMFFARNNQSEDFRGKDKRDVFEAAATDPTLELALFRSASWPYIGTPRGFTAPLAGRYRVRFSARAVLQQPNYQLIPATAPVPMTFRTRKPAGADIINEVRAEGGTLDIHPETRTYEVSVRLKPGEAIEYSLLGLPMPLARNPNGSGPTYRYPPFPKGGQPGIAYQWVEIEGPLAPPQWPPASHTAILGNLGINPSPENPQTALAERIRSFAAKAAPEPLTEETLQPFLRLGSELLNGGKPFTEALLSACQAFLASPHFIFLREPSKSANPSHALANRLAHFLTNSRPDLALYELAERGLLNRASILDAETIRLTDSHGFERFIQEFTDQWLNLRHIKRDDPDVRLFPEYRFDEYLVESLEKETRAFVLTLFRENLPAANLVQSNFVFANDRLAKHYNLPPLQGSQLRKVNLPEGSQRGGLITQGALLKVSSNGTTTSPVVRGAWMMERLIGNPPPPPPTNVPAVEPDIRGAKTIRELIKLHTKSESCSACHAKFDPIGLALENFDVLGGWRERYRGLEQGERVSGIDRAGHDFEYTIATPVDPSGKLTDDHAFKNIQDLKALLLRDKRQLARNILGQLTTYATGTPVRFSDRPVIERILDDCAAQGFRVRDLLVHFVKSPIFTGNTPK